MSPIPGSAIRRNRARCLSSNIVILRTSLGFDRLVDARCPVTLSPGGGGSHGQGQNHRSVAAVLPASSHTCPRGRGSLRPAQHIDDPCAGGGLDLATRAELPEISSAAVACLSSLTS